MTDDSWGFGNGWQAYVLVAGLGTTHKKEGKWSHPGTCYVAFVSFPIA